MGFHDLRRCGRTVSDLRERYGTLRCATVLRGISCVPATRSATYTLRPAPRGRAVWRPDSMRSRTMAAIC